tara:strand:- start:42 stop:1031 length:990 start_codon:yes stop_codon:yes gene_type:complete
MLLITYGTRPEYIKVLPVINEMKKRQMPYKTFFTGQHTDLLNKAEKPDHILSIKDGPNRLDSIVQSILNKEEIFDDITCVMVQGDTSSAFATALAAFHRKIPVAHLEAGLRTYDKYSPYPEEFNRCAISALAEMHLCPTKISASNLKKEGRTGVHIVGNTVLDNLNDVKTTTSNTVMVTLHRREKLDEIQDWFKEVNKLAKKHKNLDFVLPIHPNPEVKKHASILTNVKVIDPLGHAEFIEYLSSCAFIITDSGGVQEEAAFLKKPCIVCRDFTERVEGLHSFAVLCREPKYLSNLVSNWALKIDLSDKICPYGDGKASQYICDLIKNI